MISRRRFIRQSSITGLIVGIVPVTHLLAEKDLKEEHMKEFAYQSDFIKLQADPQRPRLTSFSTDSLGQAQFRDSPLSGSQGVKTDLRYRSKIQRNKISWYTDAESNLTPAWELACNKKQIVLHTRWKEGQPVEAFPISIAQKLNHATVLGAMTEDRQLRFPCVLHLPGMGTFRIHCSDPGISLEYDAYRFHGNGEKGEPFIRIAFTGASPAHPDIAYELESVALFPEGIKKDDPRFDGVRRNYINIFQLNPRLQTLANNSASDTCAFTVFLYAEMARRTPELAKGLTAMDLVRNSLDRYLDGMKGYGQVGYNPPNGWLSDYDSSDTAPSLIMSACYYILDTRDFPWARKNYAGMKAWADKMIATDRNGDGLVEYGYSGNAGSWNDKKFKRPANWWDTIGFGHADAYSNALAYRACSLLSEVAGEIKNDTDKAYFASFAAKLKSNYYTTFYNPATGLLAGWKSEDGQLHDYCFTFVNSVAVCYGLLEEEQSNRIMTALLAKMKEVGYTNFTLGLPGNLIPIRSEDYVHHVKRWGWGQKEDGSDGFQIYENGGATGCYAYFTIKALYRLNRKKEGDAIFYPMLESYKNGDFEGHCPGSEMTKDWKTWTGECWGYEGFLVDNYLPLLAALDV